MLEHSVVKISSAKLLGLVAAPSLALLGISGYLAWRLWKPEKKPPVQATVDEKVEKTDKAPASDNIPPPHEGIFKQIMDDNIALRHA